MFATIYLPNFYLQAAFRHSGMLSEGEKPAALIEEQEKKPVIIQLNRSAESAGIRKGMSPSQALARFLHVAIKVRALEQENVIGEILLQHAFTLNPFVEATAPGICTVQFTGNKRLLSAVDNDCRMTDLLPRLRHIIEQLAKCEITAQAAIAPTPDSSFLAAHLARPVSQITNTNEFLSSLPIETLASLAA